VATPIIAFERAMFVQYQPGRCHTVPKSKVRKKPSYAAPLASTAGTTGASKQIKPSPSWYPILMAVLLVIGLAYIVVYYMAGESVPIMQDIGSWNFAVGFGFLILGLGMAVRWK
jgi:hypothetical protein